MIVLAMFQTRFLRVAIARTPHLERGLSLVLAGWLVGVFAFMDPLHAEPVSRKTSVSMVGREFHVNGRPTYEGRHWRGHKIQGLLMNSRMVQGIFDDRNPDTAGHWAYPDTGQWDAERNTREFLAAMPQWRRHGLLGFTLNLQGGSPRGYSQSQPWHNSAIESDGSLRPEYLQRLERILDRADELGMIVILGYFYFGQDERLSDEASVIRATDNATRWILDRGYRNVLVEINNECNVRYDHDILRPERVHELIARVQQTTGADHRLLVSVSYGGGTIPKENVVRTADYLLLHGNGVSDPDRIAAMIRDTRSVPGYHDQPIVFNEDDHFDFDRPWNNLIAAVSEYASWGFFDFRMRDEDFNAGYQSVPVNWSISSDRKRAFFDLLSEITGDFVRVSPRNPAYFEFDDGRPYIPIGLNLIAPDGAFGPGETNGLRRMDDWLGKLAANGGNFARVWLSNPFWDVEHERSGVYDEAKARRIEALLELARHHNIRLKFTLEHFREISEKPRQSWANKTLHHVSRGGTATNIADFFDGDASRARFRAKLDWFAHRFDSDPIVFGWELWNEINAVAGGRVLDWTEVMLPELDRRFPRNLGMQSLGSFDGDYALAAYRRLTLMPANNVAQVHRYLDLGAPYEICHGPVDVLAADAVRTLLVWQPARPVLLAEAGAVEPRHTGPFKLYAKDLEGIILHDVLFAPFFAGAAGPGQCWHWGEYVDRQNLWHHFARFAEAIRDLDPPAEHFRPRVLEHPRLRVYALQGKRTLAIWCRDIENDWRTELEQDQSPETLSDVRLDLKSLLGKNTVIRARAYDPWQDRWTDITPAAAQLLLPAFSRSLVVRLDLEP